ncbi:hypothetical protein HY025_02770 [Candidatus Daviesbacteria bacterium]|nr:hypothetical protein [Candidatus Daviesbacteria bacterium]
MKKLAALLTSFGYLIFSKLAFAQNPVENIDIGNTQGAGIQANTSVGTLLGNSITLIFTVSAILVLAMLIWGGIEWVLSGGDKEKVANARKRIIGALIGLAIIALSFLIVRVVGQIVGFNILTNLTIPTLGNSAQK